MNGTAKKNKWSIFNLIDSLEGDKVVWMITLLLLIFSVLAISSSTSLLALEQKTSRTSIIYEQFLITGVGLLIIIACYNITSIGLFKAISKSGFAISLILLLFLQSHLSLGAIQAKPINGAWRVIKVFGFQVHVFEVVKVAMVMYLAWAVQAIESGKLWIADRLSKNPRFAFLGRYEWKLFFYVLLPMFIVFVLVTMGSVSSALFIALVMFVTIFVGGVRLRNLWIYLFVGLGLVFCIFGVYKISDGKYFNRLGTGVERVARASEDPEEKLMEYKRGTEEFQLVLDKVHQPISAKVAVKEGGLIGKGPGGSTQKYVVPVIFGDYMFSFIVEEYGLIGALVIIALYCSLLARGSFIVRNCENPFAKTAVAGLVIMISGQALMHMFVNVDIGPLTGQTLPLISHGSSSFLAFSVAFGIILSISRMAKKKMEKEAMSMEPIFDEKDEIKAGLSDLDKMDSLD